MIRAVSYQERTGLAATSPPDEGMCADVELHVYLHPRAEPAGQAFHGHGHFRGVADLHGDPANLVLAERDDAHGPAIAKNLGEKTREVERNGSDLVVQGDKALFSRSSQVEQL